MESFDVFARLFRSSSCVVFLLITGLTTADAQNSASAQPKATEPQTYRVGLKSIAIPSPSKDLSEIGSDYRVLLELLAPATNRLVAAFNRPEDLNQILKGGNTPLPQYALVEIPRSAEFVEAAFKTVTDGMAKEFGANLEANMKTAQEDLNHNLKELNSKSNTIAIGKPLRLGVLFSKPDAAAFGMVESVSAQGPETKMAAAIVVLRAQNRVLFLYLYSIYKDESTVQWLRKTSEDWADAILKANVQ
jgi:hypothetical protein